MTVTDSNLPHGRDSLTDDLRWRGLIQDSTDLDELREHLDGGTGHLLCGLRPDRAEPARRPPGAGRSPRAGSSSPGTGRCCWSAARPARSATRRRAPSAPSTRPRWSPAGCERIRDQLAPFVSLRRARTPPSWSTTWTGPARCRRSSSCATSASTSRSTRCWPARWSRPGWRPASASPSSATSCCRRNDFFELHRRYGCTLQFGGSDQWGNITAGVDYVRRRGGRPGARVHHAAGHQGRRHQVRQDRGRRGLARPGDDQPVRLLPVLGQRRRPRRRPATCATSASARGRSSRSWRRRPRSARRRGRPSGRWPRS